LVYFAFTADYVLGALMLMYECRKMASGLYKPHSINLQSVSSETSKGSRFTVHHTGRRAPPFTRQRLGQPYELGSAGPLRNPSVGSLEDVT